MKIYAVAMVKNESDIIESFCRHTLTFADGLIVCDDASVDDTREILQKLADEGLNLTVYDNTNTFGYYQVEITNQLVNVAIAEHGADLILPLDADEFLYAANGLAVREVLETLNDSTVYDARWAQFVPTEKPRENSVFLPKYFSDYMRFSRAGLKIFTGAKIITERQGTVALGNHFVRLPNGDAIETTPMPLLRLGHYPIRSVEQAMTKAIVGWANTLCVPGRATDPTIMPEHWKAMYDCVKQNGTLSFANLIDLLKQYNFQGEGELLGIQPLDGYDLSSDITLRYTDYGKAQKNFMNIILTHYEHIIDVFMQRESGQR